MLYSWMMSLLKQKGDMEKGKSSLEQKRRTRTGVPSLVDVKRTLKKNSFHFRDVGTNG